MVRELTGNVISKGQDTSVGGGGEGGMSDGLKGDAMGPSFLARKRQGAMRLSSREGKGETSERHRQEEEGVSGRGRSRLRKDSFCRGTTRRIRGGFEKTRLRGGGGGKENIRKGPLARGDPAH